MCVKKLESERLWLVPLTLKRCEQLLNESKHKTVKQLYEDVSWPTKDTLDILPMMYQLLKRTKHPTGFECWMIVVKKSEAIIGDISFHNHPDSSGTVEIGYGLIASAQGKGYGFEALQRLMTWAINQPNITRIKATCLTNNEASIRLLQKVGMQEITRDSLVIEWCYDCT
ncbi:MAG TPA: N-acetyltransferase [Firmicutes bacterium]|nr:N-acetyltransferase [Bacillota bacterium]